MIYPELRREVEEYCRSRGFRGSSILSLLRSLDAGVAS
jgi:hypothetical protein